MFSTFICPPTSFPLSRPSALTKLSVQLPKSACRTANMDYQLTRTLIGIKTYASNCTSKLEDIEEIRQTWDEVVFAEMLRMDIKVCIEYATEALEAVTDMTEQLLRGPPSNSQGPDDQRERLIELQVLGENAHSVAARLPELVDELSHRVQANDLELRIDEVSSGTSMMKRDATKVWELCSVDLMQYVKPGEILPAAQGDDAGGSSGAAETEQHAEDDENDDMEVIAVGLDR